MNEKRLRVSLVLTIALVLVTGMLALVWLVSGSMPRPVHAQGPCVAGPHSGTISSDESWCLIHSPHIVEGNVVVAEGVTLTIEPGVIVKLACPYLGCHRDLIVNGTLDAQGTSTDTIRFTSTSDTPVKGHWGRLYFGDYSTNNILDYVIVEYGGDYLNRRPSIYVATDSLLIDHSTIRRGSGEGIELESVSPIIRNTTFEDNDESALYLDGGSCFPELSNLTASGNGYDAIVINGGTYTADYTWGDAGISTYRVLANVTVNEDVTLTVEPGTRVDLGGGWLMNLNINGTLDAQGTPTNTIRFTSGNAAPSRGDWSQIRFGDYSTNNILDYVTVEYGGRCSTGGKCPTVIVNTDSLLIDHSAIRRSVGEGMQINSASPAIHNTTFEDNDEIALYLDGGACFPEMSNLTAAGNGYDAIGINGNTYIADYTWGNVGIPEYRISDSIVVNAGVTLTVEPGTTVTIGWPKALVVHGTLQAQGASTDIIRFTSASDTPGPGGWGSIQFKDTSINSILEHVTVEYGGDGIGGQANVVANTSSLTIRHSTISRSENDAIRLDRGAPVIEYNSIVDNGGYGVNNLDDSITAYAQCNWWGHASGPTHSSNPDGLGQGVSDHVVFTPWMTASDDEECIVPRPPTGVEIFGPTEGLIKTAYTFTATVSPDETALLPITYTWEADRQDPVIHFRGALTDSASFTWTMVGTFAITLTAGNPAGSHFATHTIEIGGGYSIYLPLVLRND